MPAIGEPAICVCFWSIKIPATVFPKPLAPVSANWKKQQIPELLEQLITPWRQEFNIEQIILCGMVGSSIGWLDSGYVDCPLQLSGLANSLCEVPGQRIPTTIIPGIRCHSHTGAVDIMRGEETQILGALQKQPQLCQGQHLLCLPGTHSKWVALQDGVVENFLTSLSGELFAILKTHSILARGANGSSTDETQFITGVKRNLAEPECDLLHLLFETRSRQISGQMPSSASADFLSGLIIGRDIQSALRLFDHSPQRTDSLYRQPDTQPLVQPRRPNIGGRVPQPGRR